MAHVFRRLGIIVSVDAVFVARRRLWRIEACLEKSMIIQVVQRAVVRHT